MMAKPNIRNFQSWIFIIDLDNVIEEKFKYLKYSATESQHLLLTKDLQYELSLYGGTVSYTSMRDGASKYINIQIDLTVENLLSLYHNPKNKN